MLLDLSKKDILADNLARYWIQFLNSRTGGDFQLIIIGTHSDKIKANKEQILEETNIKLGELLSELNLKSITHVFKDESTNKEQWFYSLCANPNTQK